MFEYHEWNSKVHLALVVQVGGISREGRNITLEAVDTSCCGLSLMLMLNYLNFGRLSEWRRCFDIFRLQRFTKIRIILHYQKSSCTSSRRLHLNKDGNEWQWTSMSPTIYPSSKTSWGLRETRSNPSWRETAKPSSIFRNNHLKYPETWWNTL